MRQLKTGKAAAGAIREGFSENQNQINAGGIEKRFDVFDFATKTVEKQYCEKCNPHLAAKAKRGAQIKLCPDCIAGIETTAEVIHENLQKHQTIKILDFRCKCCDKPKAAAVFSKKAEICRQCLTRLRTSPRAVQNRMIATVANNTVKNLRRAIV